MAGRPAGSGGIAGLTQLHQAVPLVERQHAIIELLRTRAPRRVPGADLAESTGVSVRTIERDITRLRAAGVPITIHRGPGGGYRIDARPRLPPVVFTPGEASVLIASLVAVGPYTSAAAHSALDKVLTALTE
ncbi:helix-turn-helix transcriptional regulator [Actinokineospora enzanensis]|uniref:helix-turn-helix transcriptional regulator n=1 Tax=Actinokineospora enzanensis TaxID=155975 RepID=UPI0003625BF5|nr:HTH domain-containing protein [Actinokineospora enzanensis]